MEYDVEAPQGNLKHFPDENLVRVYDKDHQLIREIPVDPSFGLPIEPEVDPEPAIQMELSAALTLAENSPYNTPEEQIIVDATVESALASYRSLFAPQPNTVKLATDLMSWRVL